jgi:hypothetical protein
MSNQTLRFPSRVPWTANAPAVGAPSAFSKPEIAGLSIGRIQAMSDAELVQVVHAARLPCLDNATLGRLHLLGRERLERIVFLARRTCRNQGY